LNGGAPASSRSALLWLVAGAVLGIAVAAASLVHGGAAKPIAAPAAADASDAVARVNGEPITRDSMARFANAIARSRGRLELDDDERRRVLARLVDEELLFQRGLALGMDRSEPSARRAIVSAMMDSLTADNTREPTREDLEQLLRDDPGDFVRPGRVTIEAARLPLDAPPERVAEAVRRARAGESLVPIGAELGAPIDPPLPAGPTEIDALRDRVGGLVVQAIANLAPGETSDAIRAMDGYWVVHLVAREPDTAPPLDEVYEPVRQLWIQRDHEKGLADAMQTLRDAADVEILDPSLRPSN
jgi:hypothetical protein